METGLPESFKVLISELKSLCLNIELLQEVEDLEQDVIRVEKSQPEETEAAVEKQKSAAVTA